MNESAVSLSYCSADAQPEDFKDLPIRNMVRQIGNPSNLALKKTLVAEWEEAKGQVPSWQPKTESQYRISNVCPFSMQELSSSPLGHRSYRPCTLIA